MGSTTVYKLIRAVYPQGHDALLQAEASHSLCDDHGIRHNPIALILSRELK